MFLTRNIIVFRRAPVDSRDIQSLMGLAPPSLEYHVTSNVSVKLHAWGVACRAACNITSFVKLVQKLRAMLHTHTVCPRG